MDHQLWSILLPFFGGWLTVIVFQPPSLGLTMYANFALTLPRTSFETREGVLYRVHRFDASFQQHALRVQDDERTEYTNQALISFIQYPSANGEGTFGYSPSWNDSTDGTFYPGYCEMHFRVSASLADFLDQQMAKGASIFIGVQVTAPIDALYHIGPDDAGEYHWNRNLELKPTARLDRIVPVLKAEAQTVSQPEVKNGTSGFTEMASQHTTINIALATLIAETNGIRKNLVVLAAAVVATFAVVLFNWWRGAG